MNRVLATLCLTLAASAAFASQPKDEDAPSAKDAGGSTAVRWDDIAGVITAQGVSNPVSMKIDSGTFAWTTSSGRARVDMANGFASFEVEGLVINGTPFSGTAGPVTQVVGTLVCNAGADDETAIDSAPVPLSSRGAARFADYLSRPIPAHCSNPLFLVRIAVPSGAAGRWIATGVERTIGRGVAQN